MTSELRHVPFLNRMCSYDYLFCDVKNFLYGVEIGQIVLNADVSWDNTKKSRFIELTMLDLPTQFIIATKSNDLALVIAGNQMIHAMDEFVKNKLTLESLILLPELNGMRYQEVYDHPELGELIDNLKVPLIEMVLFDDLPQETIETIASLYDN